MATVNLGRIKFVWQGAYNGATAYVADDVVSYNGSSYICILASTGNLPTNTTYWNLMAQTGTDITSIAGLAQGDVLYYNGTAWVRLGAGTSGQFLKTNGAGANPSWANGSASTLTTQGDILYRDASGLARLGAGTSGQVLTTQGSGANPQWSTVSSDWVRINTTTSTSSVSEILIDGVFSASYDLYKVFMYELKMSNNDTLNMQLRTTAPANQTGTTARAWQGYDDAANVIPNNGTGTDYRLTGRSLWNGTDRRGSIELTFTDPYKNFRTGNFYGIGQLSYSNADFSRDASIQHFSFVETTTTQFGGFRIFPNAGTIDRAKIITYGMKI